MPNINELLQKILSAVYGKDARKSIHDAVEQSYDKVGYYTPNVTNGVLSWTRSKDSLPQIPSVSIRGAKGNTGVTPVKDEDYGTEDDKNGILTPILEGMHADFVIEDDGSIKVKSMVTRVVGPFIPPPSMGAKLTFTVTDWQGKPDEDFSDDPISGMDGVLSIFVKTPEGGRENILFIDPDKTTAGTCIWDLSKYSEMTMGIGVASEIGYLFNIYLNDTLWWCNDDESISDTITITRDMQIVVNASYH